MYLIFIFLILVVFVIVTELVHVLHFLVMVSAVIITVAFKNYKMMTQNVP